MTTGAQSSGEIMSAAPIEPGTQTPDDANLATQSLADLARSTGEHLLQWFSFAHLPPALQDVSADFAWLAVKVVAKLPSGPERTVALRKLLEGKDAAVRAALEA